jgi:hypothetical protein
MPNVNLTCKRTLRQVFYLYEAPPPPSYDPILYPQPPYTLYMRIQFIYSHKEGGVGGES